MSSDQIDIDLMIHSLQLLHHLITVEERL